MLFLYKNRDSATICKYNTYEVLLGLTLSENMVLKKDKLTDLGLYLAKKSVNKAEVARKTGLSTYRMSQLSINPSSKLRADELYLIALAIGEKPGELFEYLHKCLLLKQKEGN